MIAVSSSVSPLTSPMNWQPVFYGEQKSPALKNDSNVPRTNSYSNLQSKFTSTNSFEENRLPLKKSLRLCETRKNLSDASWQIYTSARKRIPERSLSGSALLVMESSRIIVSRLRIFRKLTGPSLMYWTSTMVPIIKSCRMCLQMRFETNIGA